MVKEFIRFRDLSVGDTFDFVDPSEPHMAAFFEPCEKISMVKMRVLSNGSTIRVENPESRVFHVRRRGEL